MNRPHKNKTTRELEELIEESGDDFLRLAVVAYELQYRRHMNADQKAYVIERLVALAIHGGWTLPSVPEFEFPTTSIHDVRANAHLRLGDLDWRRVGLLGLSGYHVGEAHGVPRFQRRRILNYVFLEDDLRDVNDREYAAEWGLAKTSQRLQKLSETLAAFARNGKRSPKNMQRAIVEWEEDLGYLKSTFYERWGDFPWPDIQV